MASYTHLLDELKRCSSEQEAWQKVMDGLDVEDRSDFHNFLVPQGMGFTWPEIERMAGGEAGCLAYSDKMIKRRLKVIRDVVERLNGTTPESRKNARSLARAAGW